MVKNEVKRCQKVDFMWKSLSIWSILAVIVMFWLWDTEAVRIQPPDFTHDQLQCIKGVLFNIGGFLFYKFLLEKIVFLLDDS